MTREEAQTQRYMIEVTEYNMPSMREHIDNIYDYFESRTCENCKWSIVIVKNKLHCFHLDNSQYNKYMCIKKDFGCNKFERKENE